MDVLIFFVASALTVIALTTLSNIFIFPRLRPAKLADAPRVSVMIPARDEAQVIAETIQRMLAQNYPNFEVILLDDHSSDGTGDLARTAGQGDPRLTVMNGQALPDGWMGKNWACHQMAQRADGDYLLFTDADTRWEPDALAALVDLAVRSDADLSTVWPTQHTETWAERLCVPLMAVVIVGYLPVFGTHYVPLSAFGAANGQCMMWKRRAYDDIGGHEVVYDNVLEDVTLARMAKGRGMRLRMADGAGLVNCRMYTDWLSVRDGYAKNILAGYGSVPALLLATVFHWLIFLFPFVLLFIDPIPALLLIVMGLTVRALTAAFTRQRILDALLMPVSVLLMTRITAQSLYWHYRYGGPRWKGRVVSKKKSKSTAVKASVPHG